jgi:sucrose-6-phosphate hydrolase SacC (GH32 family)
MPRTSLPPFDAKLAPANAPSGWSVGIAEGRDLLHWKKTGELRPEQECEKKGLCAPSAIVLDGKVHLFHASHGNGRKDGICHAVSGDGLRFTRDPGHPGVFTTRDGQTWLFYQGNNDKGRNWYLSRTAVKWSDGRPGL